MAEKKREDGQSELFGFIDSVQDKMDKIRDDFFRKWNAVIKRYLRQGDDFHIEYFIDICGGYWLTDELYEQMDTELKNFYNKRAVKTDGRIFLRGYDNYQADPLMRRKKVMYDWDSIRQKEAEKFAGYKRQYTFSYLKCETVSVVNWIGILGMFEYLFSDLTSLQWFLFKNGARLSEIMGEEYLQTTRELEESVEIVGRIIACILKFDFKQTYILLKEKYTAVTNSHVYEKLIQINFDIEDKSSVRAVREGDSICLIYAAYLMKLEPFCKENHLKKIYLVSNAFGAMNIGIILKYLITSCSEAECYNILYAQNRSVEDVVYGGSSLASCCIMGEKQKYDQEKFQAVFVVDDSIFSGSSYIHIRSFLQDQRPVYLLPLTLNCDCLKYCRRGIKENDDINLIARQVVLWSSEVGNVLPPFSSFWDFCRKAPENRILTDNVELHSVLDGDDLLTKHLWAIFESEIFRRDE